MMSIEDYKKKLESMSKEELISEIGRLLVDKDLLLNSRDGYINELKEDNNRLKEMFADGTEVMDYWQDKYLEEKSKNDELQKKVDELAYELAKKSIATEGINVTSTNISLQLHEKLLQQAVKKTVKEVLQDIYNKSTCISYYGKQYRAIETVRFDGIVKSNGVEVE